MKKVVIVGSGAGGATLARELGINGFNVTLLEKGNSINIEKAHQCYENENIGVELLKTSCVGGSTLVTAGNAVHACQNEFKKIGIDLTQEFDQIDKELNVGTMPDTHFGEGTLKIMEAAESMGLNMEKMPKFINPDKCIPCGKCVFGCPRNAKWSSLDYLDEAKSFGVSLVENSPVTKVLTDNGQVTGVMSHEHKYDANVVVLCPGATETPGLLSTAGIEAGDKFFVDTFVTVGGLLQDINFHKEVSMNALYKGDGFILAPHYTSLIAPIFEKYGANEKDILSMMVKIPDEMSGFVEDGVVVKNNTANDVALLASGSALAGSILTEAGVDPATLVSTPARGAHPGGTAAIGDVVDTNLETEIEGLYVSDASVFPKSPGAPPILTILALAKRLGKHLTADVL